MAHALVTLILTAVVLSGVLSLSGAAVASVDTLAQSAKDSGKRVTERNRTAIDCTSANTTQDGNELLVSVQNKGQLPVGDFEHWDLIVEYTDNRSAGHARWLAYVPAAPGDNEWTVDSIEFDGQAEVIEPGILNAGEVANLRACLKPTIGHDTINLATVATQNGIVSQIVFAG